MSVRSTGRDAATLRPVSIETDVNRYAEGSCLFRAGETHVLCTASVESRAPGWLVGSGQGWVTAEYSMLPRATGSRVPRERAGSRPAGRTHEIQRLIGRSLRAGVDRRVFGERMITIDCDVLQADGGTRCASITGGFVALALAFAKMSREGQLSGYPLLDTVAAVSTGIVAGEALLDLEYEEDSSAEVDLNLVRTGSGRYVEIQGTAEDQPFSRERLDTMLDLADPGLDALIAAQREALGEDCLRRVMRPQD
jgi:ribonuclease PH